VVTTFAIGLAMMPAADEPNKPLAVAKIVGLTAVLIGTGWAVFASSRRKAREISHNG
jgi:glutamate:GABA antiporter